MAPPLSLRQQARGLFARVRRHLREPDPRPLVSVVVPVYNVERYLAECLDSLLAQEYDALEIIVVNDGATDSSPAIAARYAEQDPRVRVLTKPNGGLGSARNAGIDAATGQFLTFVDSDDTVPAEAYRIMVETMKDSGSDVAIGQMVRTRGKQQEIPMEWAELLHDKDRIGIRVVDFPRIVRDFYSPNKMYRTAFWKEHGFRFREGVLFEDQPLITQIYCQANTVDVLRTVTYRWRNREDDTSLSSALHELEPVRARIQAVELTRDALAGQPEPIVAAWRWSLVDHYLPNYLRGCAAIGEAELDAAIDFLRLVATPDDLLRMTDCKAQSRVICHAALAHGHEGVNEFLRARGRQVMEFPVEWIDGQPTARLPLFRDPEFPVPDALFVLSDDQFSLESWFSGAHWDGTDLLVRGRAFVEFLDSSHSPTTTLHLTNAETGEVHDFHVRVVPDTFVGPRSAHWYVDHTGADFEARIPVADLAVQGDPHATWELSVTVATPAGLSRTARLRRPSQPALVGVPFRQLIGERTVAGLVLGHDATLRLRLTTPPALLTDFAADGEGVRLKVAGPDQLEVQVNDSPSGEGHTTVCSRGTDGFHRAELSELPETGHLSWQAGADASQPLQAAPGLAEQSLVREVELAAPPPPRAVLRTPRTHLLVTGLSASETHLSVDLAGFPPGVEELTVRLVSARVDSHPCTVRVPDDGSPVTAQVPLAYTEWGTDHEGFLPRTEYRIEATAGDGTLVPWQVSPSLDLPDMLTTSRMSCKVFRRLHSFRIRVNRPLHPSEVERAAVNRRILHWSTHPEPVEDAVFFQCLRGDTASDSQLAIHEVLRKRHPGLPLYWGVQDHTVPLPEGAVAVVRQSDDWFRALHTSRWVCVNHELPTEYTKAPGQVVVQTYRGHPFKMMGTSRWAVKGSPPGTVERELEKRADWDYLVAPSPEAARLYRENFPLDVELLQVGHPRNDALVGDRAMTARRELRDRLGLADDITAVLYAPTWRDNAEDNPWKSKMVDFLDPHEFSKLLGPDHALLVRGHPANQRHRSRVGTSRAVVDVTDYPDINDVILASDVGVFDYSSIRFDYSVTRKPMVFFVPDEDAYLSASPGLMDFGRTTPGPRVHTPEELAQAIGDLGRVSSDHAAEYDEFVATFNPLDDGHAAERLVDIVFAGLDSGKERS